MKNSIQIYLTIIITLLVGFTWASDVSIPNTFTANTTAVASEVNENFTAVETAVNDNDQRITNIESSYVKGRGDLSVALTGTVTISSTTSQLLGTGTSFTSELNVGDAILVGTEIHEVASITNDTDLTLVSAHSTGALDVTAFKDGKLLSITTGAGQEKLSIDKSGGLNVEGDVTATGTVNATGSGGLTLSCIDKSFSYSQAASSWTNIAILPGAGTDTTTNMYCGSGYRVFQSRCVSGGGASTIHLNQAGIRFGGAICTYYNSGASAHTVYIQATCCLGNW